MKENSTVTGIILKRSKIYSPWKPRKLSAEEVDCRDFILQNIPGGGRLKLPRLANVLLTNSAKLEITQICTMSEAGPLPDSIYLALSGAKKGRSVLSIERPLARLLIDAILSRAEKSATNSLTSGEEGTLFFVVDRAAGDWLEFSELTFTLKGLLANARQVQDYLMEPPGWSVSANFSSGKITGGMRLLFAKPPFKVAAQSSKNPFSIGSLGHCLVNIRLIIGKTRLSTDEINNLGNADIVLTDWCVFPDEKGSKGITVLSCEKFKRQARWLDQTSLRLIEQDEENTMTDSHSVEIEASLKSVTQKESAQLEIDVHVEVSRMTMSLDKIANLMPGAVIRLNKPVGTECFLRAGEKIIAKGELVDQEGRLAVEITEVL